MKLFKLHRLPVLKLQEAPPRGDAGSLAVDDLLSRGSDGLGLDVDGEGNLILFEGTDFE